MSQFAAMIHAMSALHGPTRLVCPHCGAHMQPAEQASEGDLCRCHACSSVLAFRADGTLRVATDAERRWFNGPPEAA